MSKITKFQEMKNIVEGSSALLDAAAQETVANNPGMTITEAYTKLSETHPFMFLLSQGEKNPEVMKTAAWRIRYKQAIEKVTS